MEKYIVLVLGCLAVAHAASTQCPQMCTMQYDPVCGSDGKTYSNDCALRVKTCMSDAQISVAYRGQCGTQDVECPRMCPFLYSPVCGTDGQTYNNECLLDVTRCNSRTQLRVANQGACELSPPARRVPQPRDRSARCLKPCTMEYDPQCGTDGRTYSNRCALRVAACKARGSPSAFRRDHTGAC